MNIIKLNAIDSTNSYLKELVSKKDLDNFTVAVAKHQTSGRGQMGTTWISDYDKNLTFSMLVKFENFKVNNQFYCSMAVALGVLEVLKEQVENKIVIKWPNDILAEEDKVAGILIENVLNGSMIKHSIVGVGLNVNQELFPNNIGKVSSLKLLSGKNIKNDELLIKLIQSISKFLNFVMDKEFNILKVHYYDNLYMFNKITRFIDDLNLEFKGKIVGIEESGKLLVETENKKIRKFNLKEIKFAN
jgi:BirA family biotin operon repressor/biotin-[acetyl-CoA-carboxylase] ligase